MICSECSRTAIWTETALEQAVGQCADEAMASRRRLLCDFTTVPSAIPCVIGIRHVR